MKDLESLRKDLTEKVSEIGDEPIKIPNGLKNPFLQEWDRCEKINDGHFVVSFQEGKGTKDLLDNDFLKCIYAKELVVSLIEYRTVLQRFFDQNGVKGEDAKSLSKDAFPSKIPTWWPSIEEAIYKSGMEKKDKELLIRFVKDNGWSGCTKGVGRKQDFFHSSVVNALRSNVTHNAFFGDVAKELLDLQDLTDPIIRWYESKGERVVRVSDFSLPDISNEPKSNNLYLSLLTKPFTILTGASGTGKTKLAESLAHYLGNTGQDNHRMVAVGADWTDNRNILGFLNHLRDDGTDEKKPIYQSTPILDLLIDANETPGTPYFLILDEMNLSHVERYFADFLSVMEQKEGGVFRLHTEGTGDNAESRLLRNAADKIGVPRNLPYPPNLFVVGTVNIDETTYMFSPKVLDRSNVIEFKVTDKEIGAYLDDPKGYPEMVKAPDGVAESFLVLALKARKGDLNDLPPAVAGAVKEHLLSLFRTMEEARFEFAYRTLNEVIRYLKVCQELAENKGEWQTKGWKADLDDQILQKILPKLHGSTGRISDLLIALAEYCRTGAVPAEGTVLPKLKDIATLECQESGFGKSFNKLKSMAATLKSEQFVSFIQ